MRKLSPSKKLPLIATTARLPRQARGKSEDYEHGQAGWTFSLSNPCKPDMLAYSAYSPVSHLGITAATASNYADRQRSMHCTLIA